MNTKQDELQVLGGLMKKPTLLANSDVYHLSITDFSSVFERIIFNAIQTLFSNGLKEINVIDIDNFLTSTAGLKKVFEQQNGIEYLQDALEFSELDNFDYYYSHLKKMNLIRELKKNGFPTDDIYCEDLVKNDSDEINRNFEKLTEQDIVEIIKKKILTIEQGITKREANETISSFNGARDVFEDSSYGGDVGLPLQGKILNEVMGGARLGTLMIRSGGSGLGKSRNMVGDSCMLAFPYRYNTTTEKWCQTGNNSKVLYIATEQKPKEIQRMILAYLTGINESKFRYGNFTEKEKIVIEQAFKIWEEFSDNLIIGRMPNPTNEGLKNYVREQVILNQIEYVFYDYIFIGPALLNEFKGFALRNDELLLLMCTSLKDIAEELNVFVMTATQVNANADNNKEIRNEASLAGGRSTINKADFGFIMARPTNEELTTLKDFCDKYGAPTLVTDVFKVRSGEWNQVRIWSKYDAGTLRKEDLFVTNSRLEIIDIDFNFATVVQSWITEEESEKFLEKIERIGMNE